jgi:hypothetical protein
MRKQIQIQVEMKKMMKSDYPCYYYYYYFDGVTEGCDA